MYLNYLPKVAPNWYIVANLFTHQLPRAGKICRIAVFKQHPFLKDVDVSDINTENWKEKVAAIKAVHPNLIELSPIANWTHINPIDEAVEMMGGEDKVVVVQPLSSGTGL